MQVDKKGPSADALREAGFVPLPRLWVKPSDMPDIHQITEKYREVVNSIRNTVRDQHIVSQQSPKTPLDPVHDIDAAWAAYEKMRGS